jgi:NAD(P)-dependent dehydrogenase (short-subunit alcohol dehydrogenase family)
MTAYKIDDAEFAALHGKTILITGCATGIGRAAAVLAHRE